MIARNICVTGGAGYVGSVLVPKLMKLGHNVTVLDTFWYGDNLPKGVTKIKGDIRVKEDLTRAFKSQDVVIHLACISNDPSFELNPILGRSINLDCFQQILDVASMRGIDRFVYASSSSVYGVKEKENVVETDACDPLTDYSRYKLMCEELLYQYDDDFEWVIARPATVCGFSPRLRLDLVVNILTINALLNKKIKVFGGEQLRPNLNIQDMADAYVTLLNASRMTINKKVYNIGYENMKVIEIAQMIAQKINAEIEVVPSNDNRSYHVCSDKFRNECNFKPKHTIEQAIDSIVSAWNSGAIMADPLNATLYHNVKRMNELGVL